MGVMVYAENEGDPFLGRSLTRTSHISEETMRAVDNEIRRILEEQYTTARKLIEDNADKVNEISPKTTLEIKANVSPSELNVKYVRRFRIDRIRFVPAKNN